MMKVCSKCHIEKDESEYRERRNCCKDCERVNHREWCKENRGHCRKYEKEYWAYNKQKKSECNKRYYLKHINKIKEKGKDRYNRNKESILRRNKLYAIKNAAHLKLYYNDYFKKNRIRLNKMSATNKRKYIKEIKDWYIKILLTQHGVYSKEDIKVVPDLLSIKKIKLTNHRLKTKK